MRTKKWAKGELSACPFHLTEANNYKNRWETAYPKNQPFNIELGCGKGTFISKLAVDNPEQNYLAMDLSSDMLGLTKRAIEREYAQANRSVDNVRTIWQDIERIRDTIGEEDRVHNIYINFSNPWYKERHYKRRLTHTRQLLQYRDFMVDDGRIYFKTDDDMLFEHSLEYFKEAKFEVEYITYDLHSSGYEGNIVTEHETMYSAEGIKIKFLIAKKV